MRDCKKRHNLKALFRSPHSQKKSFYFAYAVLLLALSYIFVQATWRIKASALINEASPSPFAYQKAELGDSIAIEAVGRGNPWINMADGREVITSFAGPDELTLALQQNMARPLTLASADFDEDGVPDLITSYDNSRSGIITLLRGNIDSIFPESAEALKRKSESRFTDAPFISPAFTFALPRSPDFIGAGDFDGDSHRDVVAAARGGNKLYLLKGNGQGDFDLPEQIDLPGAVTALITGEMNRQDGLEDIIIGIDSPAGPKALVLEGPNGAFKAVPESFALPASASGLALARLDDDCAIDLAVAAGKDLLVIKGRDRKLSLDQQRQAEVPQAKFDRRSFPVALKSVAAGNFSGSDQIDLALLFDDGTAQLLMQKKAKAEKQSRSLASWKSEAVTGSRWPQAKQLARARISSLPGDDLIVLDSASRQLHVVAKSAEAKSSVDKATLSASLNAESEPVAVLPMRLNKDARSSLVVLKSGQSRPSVLLPQAAMTIIVSDPVDGNPDSLRDAINTANSNPGTDTITFNLGTGTPSIVIASALPTITESVIIDGNTGGAMRVEINGNNITLNGLNIMAGSCTLRALVINRCDGVGISLASNGNNIIENCFIGTGANGTVARSNSFDGVAIANSNNNTIGGTTAGARNVISANQNSGVIILSGTGNQVQGNFIGTDVNGTAAALGNTVYGVEVRSSNNTIGGMTAGARNVISANQNSGINISVGTGNQVQGNFIGTNANGTAALGNDGNGADIVSDNNTIGGTMPGAGNVISSNTDNGIIISSGAGNQVQGNFIGTDSNGTADLGNAFSGVRINSSNNTIGGVTAGAGNTIAFNLVGIAVNAGNNTGNRILQNSIYKNIGLGIDLGSNGVTPNDVGDGDMGANNLQNFPVLTSAASNGGSTNIQGMLNSAANTLFRIEFFSNTACDDSGNGEGETFIGATSVTTNGSGDATINFMFPGSVSPGQAITATATDPSNNTSEFSSCILLCSITCPANVTVTNDAGQCGAVVNYPAPSTTGACSAVICSPPSGSQFAAGVTIVTCSESNGVNCSFMVRVNDTEPPNLSLHADIAQSTDADQCSAVVNYSNPPVTDNCSGATVMCSPASGSTFAKGITTVNCTATDSSNNVSSNSFAVKVDDNQAPSLTCPADIIATALPGQNSTVVSYADPAVTDNCPGTITPSCVPPSGSTFPIGATPVNCNAADASSNSGNCSFAVTVNRSPGISVSDVSVVEGNNGTTSANFTVSLTASSTLTTTVAFATADGAAKAGSDYIAASGTVTFNPGETSMPVTVAVNGDTTDEFDESFFINLSSPTNAIIADAQGACVIVDDDALPVLSISDANAVEGNSGTTNADFTLNLSAVSGKVVTVRFATADGSARAGSDYEAKSGTLIFNPGETSKTITVPVIGDTLNEAHEVFFINLSDPTNATVLNGQSSCVIINDDGPPSISINDVRTVEGNSSTSNVNFIVSLSAVSAQTVTVNFATANGTAVAGSDYRAKSGALAFNPGETNKTITIEIFGDEIDEPNESFFINLTNPVNAMIDREQGACVIANEDALADLSLNQTSSTDLVSTGDHITFNITIRNAGPATAEGVALTDRIPDGATFSSAEITQGTLTTPQVGTNGTVTFLPGPLASDSEATISITLNVVAVAGTILENVAEVTSASVDPISTNNRKSKSAEVKGGGLVILAWEQPPSTIVNPTPAPINLRVITVESAASFAPSTRAPLDAGALGETCSLIRIDIYISKTKDVMIIPENLWASVPPTATMAEIAASASGSFYRLVAVWDCQGTITFSPPSDEAHTPAGPPLDKVKAASKLKLSGSDFENPIEVFIDNMGFSKKAKINADKTQITQKGNLTDGRSILEATPVGVAVIIKIVNSDGGVSTIVFQRK